MACGTRAFLVAWLIVAVSPAAAPAQFGRNYEAYLAMQDGGRPAIGAVGTVVVKRNPTHMKMLVQLFGKGKTPEEALANLSERREAAALQVESLKADKKSVVFSETSFSAAEEAVKKRFEALVRQQMQTGGKVPKGLKIPQSATVTCTMCAEWPLEADSRDKLLLLVRDIQDKIKAADLSGGKETKKLSPEEEELAEETRQLTSGDDEQRPAGEPTFLFAARISKQDREKAMAEAYAKAKERAGDLAKAAGVKIGDLIGLGGGCSGENSLGDDDYSSYSNRGMPPGVRELLSQSNDADESDRQALSAELGPVSFRCYVTATFAVAK